MKSFVKLRVAGEGLDVYKISDKLEIENSMAYKKGDDLQSRFDKEITTAKEDCYLASFESEDNESAEACLGRVLKTLKPHSNYLRSLSEKAEISVWISLYPEEFQMNFHLSPENMKMIIDMGASFDMSAMYLEKLYDGSYRRIEE